MHSPITFDRPVLLLLAPALAVVFWALARRSWSGLSTEQLRQSLILRIAVVSLIVLALAGPHLVRRTSTLSTLFVLDVSQSIRPDQHAASLAFIRNALKTKRAGDEAGLVVFGKDPYVEIPPSTDIQMNGVHAAVSPDSTDIQAALQAASSAFGAGTCRRIVLLTDGNENVGAAAGEIADLKAQGIQVDVAPTDLAQSSHPAPEALVDDLILPPRAEQDAPFTLRTVLASNVAQKATLTIDRDGKAIWQQSVLLKPGKTAVVVSDSVATAGFHRYQATLSAPEDTIAGNNQADGFVQVQGRPRILYVADTSSPLYDTLSRAMSAQGIQTQIVAPAALPKDIGQLMAYDSIVFGDVPATEFSPDQLQAVREAVRDFGVGFGMVGGEHAYAAGAYAGTPIEEILPVSMQIPKTRRLPAADVVIVLDASGSMSAEENGVEKVELAARAATDLMGALRPEDRVAVIAVTETPTIVVPLESSAKAKSARSAVESLRAGGGGIYCRTGLEAAYTLLEEKSDASIKHVIICPDTTDSEQQEGSVALAANMRKDEHITTSVCGIGQWHDQHVPYQKALAAAGGGQLYVVSQAGDLPQLFQRDVQSVQQSLFVEKPFLPQYNAQDTVVAGVPFATEPPLLGYNLATPKAGAAIALTAPGTGDPVFAHWQYGVGRTFAFTSDDRAHWAARWLGWPGYTRFWGQVLRWSLKASGDSRFQAVADADNGRGHVVVDAFTVAGGYINGAKLSARIVAPDLSTQDAALSPTGPGRYESRFDAAQTGTYLIAIRESGGGRAVQTMGLAVPYSPELRALAPNVALLADLSRQTGGRFLQAPREAFRPAPARVLAVLPLAPALVLIAALAFLLDVAWRRLGLRWRSQAVLAGVRQVTAAALRPPEAVGPEAGGSTGRARAASGREGNIGAHDDEYLSRPASTRLVDEDDPFPYVASLPRGRAGEKKKPPAGPQ